MMRIKETMVKKDAMALKQQAAQFVGSALGKWLRGMESKAFATWTRYMWIMRAHDQAGEQIQSAIKVTEDKAKEEVSERSERALVKTRIRATIILTLLLFLSIRFAPSSLGAARNGVPHGHVQNGIRAGLRRRAHGGVRSR